VDLNVTLKTQKLAMRDSVKPASRNIYRTSTRTNIIHTSHIPAYSVIYAHFNIGQTQNQLILYLLPI